MHFLGVPTTRALSLVATGEAVVRDMFYDGPPAPEPGAVGCRVAPSFVRFGNFQVLEEPLLGQLAAYVIRTHFPGHTRASWFAEVCRRSALLMVDWMRLGFVHGVMNTDNMSILGLTIDYGPYGWLEGYDPMWTPNTTDAHSRRYTYGNQPHIAQWNLARLAEALLPLVAREELEKGLALYADTFNEAWPRALAQKLGLGALDQPGDDVLANDLFAALLERETDFTLFFRRLITPTLASLAPAFYADPPPSLGKWLERYTERSSQDTGREERMRRANPKYVFRNYLAVQAIDALGQRGDGALLERLMHVLQRPYDEQPEHEDLAARRPEWARERAGASALSCSS
jgi:uncharacterized protein YdiU (UPF0061 family)